MGDLEFRARHRVLLWALVAATLATGCKSEAGKPAGATGCTDPLMIDDMEDGDGFICPSGGRHGDWYTEDDGTSMNISPKGDFTQTLIPGGRDGSRYAARLTGFGFTQTGALMGLHLNGEGPAAEPYDASAFEGVKFWMKSGTQIVTTFTMPETLPVGEPGGTCMDGPGEGNCDNHYRFLAGPTPLDEWVEYQVPFSTLRQVPLHIDADGNRIYGSVPWNPSHVVGIEFNVQPFQTFDVWVDDIRFYSCATPDCAQTCTDPNLPVACPPTQDVPTGCWSAGTDCSIIFPGRFEGVWGSGPSDVWAVGNHQTATTPVAGAIEHWDGTAWTAVPNGAAYQLNAVWGTGPSDVWAVGEHGTILHWNGAAWSAVPSGTPGPLYGVWGSGPSDVWAVGFAGTGTILHWDGTAWSSIPSGTDYYLLAVWGSGPSDVWAVGTPFRNGGGIGIFEHWDGTAWSAVPSATPGYYLGLWGSGPSDVWAVGSGISHWNGSAWSDVPSNSLPPLPQLPQQFLGVGGSGPNDVWAVAQATALHWNGTAWSAVPANTPALAVSVWSSGPNNAWWVGFGFSGSIDHWDGATWSATPVGTLP
jgi:hypothetical protein